MNKSCRNTTIRGVLFATVLATAGCASVPSTEGELIADPYEGTNRSIHSFNKALDANLLKPVAEGYDYVTPATVKLLVHNEMNYLRLPGIFINRLLQGDLEEAGAALARFALNTTIGGLGALDPATEFGLPHTPTDFGVTLAVWGAEEGVYVEAPFWGPNTTRHLAGRIVNMALDPSILVTFGVVDFNDTFDAVNMARWPLDVVNTRYENAAAIDPILYESEDSYVAARSAYVQYRRRFVAGEVTEEQLPDIFGDE